MVPSRTSTQSGWLSFLFWRVWKFVLRLITKRCELQRICNKEDSLPDRTHQIAVSLRNSKNQLLRNLAGSGDIQSHDAVSIVLRVKNIDGKKDANFVLRLEPTMRQMISLNYMKAETQRLVKEKYSQDNSEHEKSLLKLWDLLMPQTLLQSRITKQWGDIGFQGNNPATDFRGMGVLGLHCLVYFAECYNDKARKVLGNSQHPTKGYPLAIVGINMTSTLVNWLNSGITDYYYNTVTKSKEGNPKLLDFLEAYSFLMYSFNQYWIDANPENVMEFPRIKEQFAKEMEQRLSKRPIHNSLSMLQWANT